MMRSISKRIKVNLLEVVGVLVGIVVSAVILVADRVVIDSIFTFAVCKVLKQSQITNHQNI